MIEYNDAKQRASEFMMEIGTNVPRNMLAIDDHATREEPFGWVFFYNDK